MVIAMFSITFVDALAKHLSIDYSPLFISWARYAVACAVVLPIAVALHGRNVFPSDRRVSHLLRTVFLVTAMTLYFLAIARIPLSTAVSAYFVGPIIAVVFSVILLKEQVTSWKILCLILGFTGSIIIVRPSGQIDPGIFLALGAGTFFALYLITTRQAAQESDPVKTLVFQCVVGMVILTPQALLSWSSIGSEDILLFAGLGLLSAASHFLSIAAFRLTDASTLAPLVYVELISASLIGYLAFNEIPTITTLIGAGFIMSAGLIMLQRQNRRLSDRTPLS